MTNSLFSPQIIYEFIKEHPPFRGMSKKCLMHLAETLEIKSYKSDFLLIKKGELKNTLYILMKGRLHYQITDSEGHVTLSGELNEGALIGEMALLSDLPRSANVYTIRDSIILTLSQKQFMELSSHYPELLKKFISFTIKRLTDSLQGINKEHARNKSVALIPIRPISNLQSILINIIRKFNHGDKILLLNKDSISKVGLFFDKNGNVNEEGISWISQLENEYRFIFYVADMELSKWTQFCIRQSDSIAFLASADDHFELSKVEKYLMDDKKFFLKRKILIQLHKGNSKPHNTNLWLKKRNVKQHFHIKIDTDDGLARLMRILTDRTLALVLSGGGARGIAHVGLVRLLTEKGVHIDYFAGTSMGAFISGLFAMNNNADEVLSVLNTYMIKGSKLDYTYPYISISSGKRIATNMKAIYGEEELIEDLWYNFFCVSTDIVTNKLHVHERGLLWKAIRSSCSLPFIYPPVSDEERLLIDGGILNNIPVDIMQQFSPSSKVIASNITSSGNSVRMAPLPQYLSGWSLLFNKILRKEAMVPMNMVELVLRLLTITSDKNTQKMLAISDYYVDLKMEKYNMLDFKKYQEIANEGYQQAKKLVTDEIIESILK